jgi:hypothetical protein
MWLGSFYKVTLLPVVNDLWVSKLRKGSCVLLQVLSAIINNDLQGLVDSRPLKAWKETLALIFTVCIFFSQSSRPFSN